MFWLETMKYKEICIVTDNSDVSLNICIYMYVYIIGKNK